MSLGLSFDSKPTKVPKKVIICLNRSLTKSCDLKSVREYRKVKESRYTGSVLPVTELGGDGVADIEPRNPQSPLWHLRHLVLVGGPQPGRPIPAYRGCRSEPRQAQLKGPMITQVPEPSGSHATKPEAPAHRLTHAVHPGRTTLTIYPRQSMHRVSCPPWPVCIQTSFML